MLPIRPTGRCLRILSGICRWKCSTVGNVYAGLSRTLHDSSVRDRCTGCDHNTGSRCCPAGGGWEEEEIRLINSLLEETKIIQSIGYDQHEIILDILQLHCPGGIELDPTYNVGGFYRHSGIPIPKYCFDINPLRPECLQGDCRQLPLPAGSIRSMIFDPPFMATSVRDGNTGKMAGRYSYVKTMPELHSLYEDSLKEFSRVLLPRGILIFKCQDSVNGRRNYFTHVWIMNKAEELGFQAIDLFIKLSKYTMRSWNHQRQFYARKHHSYFWVFKKKRGLI